MVNANVHQSTGAELRLKELGIVLTAPPTPFGNYAEAVQTGNLLFLTGMLPVVDHKPSYLGRLGSKLNAREGRDAARIAALSALAAMKAYLGSLDRVTKIVRIGVYMAATADFFDQPGVADGASDLFRDVFGNGGVSARLVIGVASLPLGLPIELEVIAEVAQ